MNDLLGKFLPFAGSYAAIVAFVVATLLINLVLDVFNFGRMSFLRSFMFGVSYLVVFLAVLLLLYMLIRSTF